MELPLQLAMKLAPVLRSPRAEVGLAFRHLITGEAWTHNDRRFPAGDLIRLPLALAAYRAAEAGKLPLTRTLKGEEDGAVTVRDLIRRTVSTRDGVAPRLLLDHLDAKGVNLALDAWGLARTRLEGSIPGDSRTITTPSEMALILAGLYLGEWISPDHGQELLTFLRLDRQPTPLRKLNHDAAHLEAEGDCFRHIVHLTGTYMLVALTEGKVGAAALAMVAQTVEAHYAGVEDNMRRISAALTGEKEQRAPDSRLVAWDVTPVWREGKLQVIGRTSEPAWPQIVDHLRTVSDVPIVDRVRRLGATPPWAIAQGPVVHLRKAATHASEMVSQVVMGSVLEVLEAGDEWWYVRAPDGLLAFARSTNLRPATEHDAERWLTRDQVQIVAPLVTAPRLTTGAVTFSAGTRLAFVGKRRDGVLGRTPGREEVLLPEASCRVITGTEVPPAATAQAIIEFASPFLGVPYLWGGASGWGLDCSGFTQLVFGMAGIQIPRDSDQQLHLTDGERRIAAIQDLELGDLVFFPGHVGIYIGRGEFVHASAPAGSVTVNALSPGAPHYSSGLTKKFLGGGRLL